MAPNSILNASWEDILGVVTRHGGRNVRIFGSQARGEARLGSDVDILVALEAGRGLLDIVAIKQDLEDLLGRSVDVVTEATVSPYIREHVIGEAVSL